MAREQYDENEVLNARFVTLLTLRRRIIRASEMVREFQQPYT